MRTNKSNKVNNMTKNSVKNLVNMLREDCQKLVSISNEDRNEKGDRLTYKEKGEKNDFFMAYKKAKLHFGQLARTGEEGRKIAHIIFGSVAHEDVNFRLVEDQYLKAHPEDKGFFDKFDYYEFTRKKSSEEKIRDRFAAENSAREAKREKAVVSNGRRNRKIAAIVIVILIAVAAFAVAVYKKGLKPVLKAIAFGAVVTAVIFAFRKAQDAVLDRIHRKFYGNK